MLTNASHQRGPQGVRGDRCSGSKVTNLAGYEPFRSSDEKLYAKHYSDFKDRTIPMVQIEPTHSDFIFPITAEDISNTLSRVPSAFIQGVKAVLVPSGSKKQIKSFHSLFSYGLYWRECIFLHPYPKSQMDSTRGRKPNPQIIREYKRAGAEIHQKGTGVEVIFTASSLRQFYLRDVLMHEIGHHNDAQIDRPQARREAFAHWFAAEYGFRLWGR